MYIEEIPISFRFLFHYNRHVTWGNFPRKHLNWKWILKTNVKIAFFIRTGKLIHNFHLCVIHNLHLYHIIEFILSLWTIFFNSMTLSQRYKECSGSSISDGCPLQARLMIEDAARELWCLVMMVIIDLQNIRGQPAAGPMTSESK